MLQRLKDSFKGGKGSEGNVFKVLPKSKQEPDAARAPIEEEVDGVEEEQQLEMAQTPQEEGNPVPVTQKKSKNKLLKLFKRNKVNKHEKSNKENMFELANKPFAPSTPTVADRVPTPPTTDETPTSSSAAFIKDALNFSRDLSKSGRNLFRSKSNKVMVEQGNGTGGTPSTVSNAVTATVVRVNNRQSSIKSTTVHPLAVSTLAASSSLEDQQPLSSRYSIRQSSLLTPTYRNASLLSPHSAFSPNSTLMSPPSQHGSAWSSSVGSAPMMDAESLGICNEDRYSAGIFGSVNRDSAGSRSSRTGNLMAKPRRTGPSMSGSALPGVC